MSLSIHGSLRVCAWLASALVLAMVAIFLGTGVGQDGLQFVHPAADYAALLLKDPTALRAAVGLDDAFLLLYTAGFVLLAFVVPRPLVRVAVVVIVVVGCLDLAENAHFLAMLAGAESGAAPGDLEIRAQVMESLVKFHLSYLGLFLLSLGLPRRSAAERWLGNLGFLQLPLGVLIYVVPHAVAVPLVFARFTYFVAALGLMGKVYGEADSGAPA